MLQPLPKPELGYLIRARLPRRLLQYLQHLQDLHELLNCEHKLLARRPTLL